MPPQYEVGKLAAYRLICLLTIQPLDISLPKSHLTLFYRAVHNGISSNDTKVLHALVKYTGPRLFSLNLPGSSLLILDYIQASNVILSSQDLEVLIIDNFHYFLFLFLLIKIQSQSSFFNENFFFIKAPRTEAVSILGSLLSLPSTASKLPVLQPDRTEILTTTCPFAKVKNISTIFLF